MHRWSVQRPYVSKEDRLKRIRWTVVAGIATWMVSAAPVLASVELDATWSEGIRLGSADGSTTIKFGGRLQNDWVFQSGESALLDALGDEDGPASLEDGTEFRRVRLYTEGLVRNNTEFKVQFDFAGGAASLKDAYVGVVGVPALGTVRVGHQFEPFGLEEQTSSKYIVFLERGRLDSLNASVAAAVILFEAVRQRTPSG
jgi:phosphate-selective porin